MLLRSISLWSKGEIIITLLQKFNYFIFSVFGIPIIIDDKLNRDRIVHDLIDQLSVNAPKKLLGFHIPKEDMRDFLAVVKKQSTVFDPQAEIMLKRYFTATKTIRKSKHKNIFNFGHC